MTDWLEARARDHRWRSPRIGGWLDVRSDDVWLDLVRVVSPAWRRVACLVARTFQQHCVFDLGRRELVVLHGDA